MKRQTNFWDAVPIMNGTTKDNGAAGSTIDGAAGEQWVVLSIHVGFNKVPTSPKDVSIAFAGGTVWSQVIDDAVPHEFLFPKGFRNAGNLNEDLLVLLNPSGAAGTIGYVNFSYI